jgi:lysyl-tRNA synthetase class 1
MVSFFSARYLDELETMGIYPDRILFQSEEYFQKNRYDQLIYHAIRKRKKIMRILKGSRTGRLKASWHPLILYCDHCKTLVDQYQILRSTPFSRRYAVIYNCQHCDCSFSGHVSSLRFKKLVWRIDWPMRCSVEQIDFEPYGIDHLAVGSTIWTASKICRKVFHKTMPIVFPYAVIKLKGMKKKLSSSRGDILNINILLKMYSKQQILWMYLSRRPMDPIVFDLTEGFFRYHSEYDSFLAMGNQSQFDNDLRILIGCTHNKSGYIRVKALCFAYQAFAGNEQALVSHFSKINPNVPLEELTCELKMKIPLVVYWLENFAPARYQFYFACPTTIALKHYTMASTVLHWLDRPWEPVSFAQPSLFYETMFSKSNGPRIQTIFTYHNHGTLRAHCTMVQLRYEETMGKGEVECF